MSKDILIVGAGIAGLTVADRLSNQPDVKVTLVAPNLGYTDNVSTKSRTSTPLLASSTIDKLGIPTPQTPEISTVQFGLTETTGVRRLLIKAVERRFQGLLGERTIYAVDAERARQSLLTRIQLNLENSNVTLIEGKATDVQTENNRVTGISIDNKERQDADLVIDATGRQAKLVSKLESDKVNEKKSSQLSTILGGYIDLSDLKLAGLDRNLVLGTLPGRLAGILAPTEPLPNSTATHLFLLEGNPGLIRKAVEAETERDQINGNRRSTEDRRLSAMIKLTEGTAWQPIISEALSIDRTVFFINKDKVFRRPNVQGLALVGDAQGYVNPINAVGYSYIAKDAQRLTDHILTDPDLNDGIQVYNGEMQTVFDRRFKTSQRVFRGIQLLQTVL